MARTLLPTTPAATPNPSAGVALTLTAGDVANGNAIPWTGKEIIVIQNSHASTTYTFTVTSAPDASGRLGDITSENIVAGAVKTIGPLADIGWRQTDGQIYISVNNAAVKIGVITF